MGTSPLRQKASCHSRTTCHGRQHPRLGPRPLKDHSATTACKRGAAKGSAPGLPRPDHTCHSVQHWLVPDEGPSQEATCGDRGASHSARTHGSGGLLTGKQPWATCHCAWGSLVPVPTHLNSTIQRSCPKGQCLHQDLWPQFSCNGG